MSPATLAWSAVSALVTAVACLRLLRASNQPEHFVRNGYRWLVVAAICLTAGAIAQDAFGGLIGGAQPLRMADLISLAALPALVIGLAALTSDGSAAEPVPGGHGLLLHEPEYVPPAGPPQGIVVDSCLLVSSLFVICLVTLFGPDYATADAGRAAFALALVRPTADLIALGAVLWFVLRSPRLGLLPALGLAAVALGDALAVGNRIAGSPPGPPSRVALIVAVALLALAPPTAWTRSGLISTPAPRPGAAGSQPLLAGRSWSSPATVAALVAAAVAAVVVTGFSVGGGQVPTPLLAVACSVVVVLLVARLAGLTRRASAVAASAQEYDWMFRALADTTSDAVMICDLTGAIEYVSQGVTDFGYAPEDLAGRRLADLVHPEDRPSGIRAAITGIRAEGGTATFAGRVRGADGSWRHVESTLSRYGASGEPTRLLITTRDVSDRVALQGQVAQLTFHDGLTGLPNRAYVEELVSDRGSGGREPGSAPSTAANAGPERIVAAILVDIDPAVHELAGTASADLLLAQAGRRLRAAVPPPATVARWSNAEFAVVDVAAPSAEEVIELAESVAGQCASEPFLIAGKDITVTASIGVATGSAEAAEQVLANAGIALLKAKERGGGSVEVFDDEMSAHARRRAELAGELRQAIAENQLQIEYLPVVELASSALRGVEALVRWPRASETVGTDELLAVAQEAGLDAKLSDWVLGRACQQIAALRSAGSAAWLSVKCSSRVVAGPRFAASVLAALDGADLPARALTLEVSERALPDSAAAVGELPVLRQKGVRLAVKSFGTGSASLTYLRRSTVDVIKIDSSFVAGLESDPRIALLTRAIVQLARELGVEVIGEGIERAGQRRALESMGCQLGQGPAIAGPLTARDMEPDSGAQGEDTPCTTAS